MTDVNVACCLPTGLTLTVGKAGTPEYAVAELVGVIAAGNKAVSFPNRKGLKFGVTAVPVEIWNAWLAKNKALRYVVDKSVFVVT